jgi:hypothetical protein
VTLQNSKFLIFVFLNACAFQQTRAPANLTDYYYIQNSSTAGAPSTSFETRRALDGVLYSRCRWLPSDSAFFEGTARTCGTLKAAVFALGRSFEEFDIASDPKRPVVNHSGHLRWVHMPLECPL